MVQQVDPKTPQLKVGEGWIGVFVKMTVRGYAPVLPVKVVKTSLDYILYISAKSLAEPLEELRTQNDGGFTNLRFEVRKEGTERSSRYEVRHAT